MAFEGPAGTFEEADLPGNQARVTLAALAVERSPIGRDHLADIVWGEDLPSSGWNPSLNSIISKIRSLLDRTGVDAKTVLTSSGGSYQLVLPSNSWVDIEDAVSRLDRAEGMLRHGDTASALPEATAASAVLRRPFLSGLYGEWVDTTRASLRLARFRCLEVLATSWLAEGDATLATIMAERAIELEPVRETGYRLLMEAELARGDAVAALRAFDRCESMVRNEFGLAPSSATLAVLERVRRA
jgi:SARP family transcriptional regulator, regulator of embCAB operon